MLTISRGSAAAPPESEALPAITEPYVLFVRAAHEIDEQGRRWTFPAWAKDLALHLDYLHDLTLVSPVTRTKGRSANLVSLDEPPFDRLKFIDLPYPTSRREALKTLPRYFLQCWRAIGPARVVHSGLSGWPFMQAWVVVPLARARGKFVVTNVESSVWRAYGTGVPWHKRLRSSVSETLCRATLRMSDLRVHFESLPAELMPPGAPRAYVTPATWLNEEWLLGEEEALAAWAAKQGPVRLVYAGRLVSAKGVSVLLAAIQAAAEAGTDVEFVIHPIGDNTLRDECVATARSWPARSP